MLFLRRVRASLGRCAASARVASARVASGRVASGRVASVAPVALASLVVALTAGAATTACGASGEVEGGEPFDGGGTTLTPPATGDDGGPVVKVQKGCAGPDASTGSTYTELYQDYFGPSGGANCSGTVGACHGEPSGAGALGSGGFVCGTSQASCLTGMNVTTADLLSPSDTSHPASSGLEVALRKAEANGTTNNMPLVPVSCVFSDDDIARISAWIAAGAPNN